MGDSVGQWWTWFLAWVIVVIVVFVFFGLRLVLKGAVGCVGSDVWIVAGLWLNWVVGRGSTSWVQIGGLGSVDGGFETVDLLIGGWIGWVDHR